MLGEASQNFAVHHNAGFLYSTHEFGIRDVFGVQGGVDFDYPEIPAVAFLVAPMSERIGAGMHQSLVGGGFVGGTAEAIALCLTQDISAIFQGVDCFFYSCHVGELKIKRIKKLAETGEEPRLFFVGHMKSCHGAFLYLRPAALFGIEMILAGSADQDFPVPRDFQPFGV